MDDTLTFYAGNLPHFADFLAPLYHAMPEDRRGVFYARGRARDEARRLGVSFQSGAPKNAPLVITASYEDYRAVKPSRVILVNHGIGQTYKGVPSETKAADNPCYSGGNHRDRVVLHICPSQRDAEVNRVSGQLAAAIGPYKLDPWLPRYRIENPEPVVAISQHADIHVCPETRWSFPHYKQAFIRLAEHASNLGIRLLGHSHPRVVRTLQPFWESVGVEFTPHFSDVLDRADLYMVDNSSTLFEFAATGRPVVVLDAPWYRTQVEHGLRFWSAADVGVRIQDPHDLEQAILTALEDVPLLRKRRERIVSQVYDGVALDGRATERAVKAILDLMDSDG